MIFDKYLIFTNIMCNNCILSNIYIGTKEGVPEFDTPSFFTNQFCLRSCFEFIVR